MEEVLEISSAFPVICLLFIVLIDYCICSFTDIL